MEVVDITTTLSKALSLFQEREAGLKTEIDQVKSGAVAEAILASIQANGKC